MKKLVFTRALLLFLISCAFSTTGFSLSTPQVIHLRQTHDGKSLDTLLKDSKSIVESKLKLFDVKQLKWDGEELVEDSVARQKYIDSLAQSYREVANAKILERKVENSQIEIAEYLLKYATDEGIILCEGFFYENDEDSLMAQESEETIRQIFKGRNLSDKNPFEYLSDMERQAIRKYGAVKVLVAMGYLKNENVYPTERVFSGSAHLLLEIVQDMLKELAGSITLNEKNLLQNLIDHLTMTGRELEVVDRINEVLKNNGDRPVFLVYGANHNFGKYFNNSKKIDFNFVSFDRYKKYPDEAFQYKIVGQIKSNLFSIMDIAKKYKYRLELAYLDSSTKFIKRMDKLKNSSKKFRKSGGLSELIFY